MKKETPQLLFEPDLGIKCWMTEKHRMRTNFNRLHMCMRNTSLPLANCSKLLISVRFFHCPRILHHWVWKFCCLWESHGLSINEERLSTCHGSCLFLIILSIRLQSATLLAQTPIKLAPVFLPLAILCYFYCSSFHQIRKRKVAAWWSACLKICFTVGTLSTTVSDSYFYVCGPLNVLFTMTQMCAQSDL